jgi:amino acid transporter
MDLFFLLRCIAAGAGFLPAFLEGKNNGASGILISLVVGLVVGFIGYWGMRMLTAKKLIDRILLCKQATQHILGYIGLFATLVWILFSAFLGSWLTKVVIHLCQ